MKNILYGLVASVMVTLSSPAHSFTHNDCSYTKPNISFKEIPNTNKIFYVDGELSGFNPCHRSVDFSAPKEENGPVFVILHGSIAGSRDIQTLKNILKSEGYGTLTFDAFSMNHGWKTDNFWLYSLNNESKQRMLYTTGKEAFTWLLNSKKIKPENIYFYGISNGATVAANLAATKEVNAAGFFAEGMPGMGIGLPNKLVHNLTLFYGKLDNYAGLNETEWVWVRQDYCILNSNTFAGPEGNAKECNKTTNPGNLTEQPIKWFNRMKEAGNPVEIVWLEGGGHSVFLGELTRGTITFGTQSKRVSTIGGSKESADMVVKTIKEKVNKK